MIFRPAIAALARDVLQLPEASQAPMVPWVSRILASVGPLAAPRASTMGELDGFEGIHHRGQFNHLLASEWALAEADELEFMRRATQGELSFYNLARREPLEGRASVVLLNAGHEQLGVARIVHLALLMAFYLRAQAASAEFHWGILHCPGIRSSGLDVHDLKSMLRARSLAPHRAVNLRRWRDHINEELANAEDLWVVDGVSRSDGEVPAFQEVIVEPRTFVDNVVDLEFCGQRAGKRTVSLTLPDAGQRVALLRDPFRRGSSAMAVAAGEEDPRLCADSYVVFSHPGHRLCCREPGEGRLLGLHLPQSPRERAGRTRTVRLREGEKLVAVGFYRRSMIALTWCAGLLYVRKGRAAWATKLRVCNQAPTWNADEGVSLLYWRGDEGYTLRPNGELWFLDDESIEVEVPECLAHDFDSDTSLVRWEDRGFYVAGAGAGEWLGKKIESVQGGFVWLGHAARCDESRPDSCFAFGIVAARVTAATIRLWLSDTTNFDYSAEFADDHYLGVVHEGGEYKLLFLCRDRRSLNLSSSGRSQKLLHVNHQIRRAQLHATTGRVALMTTVSELIIYDLKTRQVLRRVHGGTTAA